jgi:hypothetical protein
MFVYSLVTEVEFVSVMTDLSNVIKPTYISSCVWVCYWLQVLLSRKSSQSTLSKVHITTRIPLRKETCLLTATIAQIIPEINQQKGQRWQKAYRCRQRDSKWGSVGKETSDARGTPTSRWRGSSTGSDIGTTINILSDGNLCPIQVSNLVPLEFKSEKWS